jgi:hypothetical protein
MIHSPEAQASEIFSIASVALRAGLGFPQKQTRIASRFAQRLPLTFRVVGAWIVLGKLRQS